MGFSRIGVLRLQVDTLYLRGPMVARGLLSYRGGMSVVDQLAAARRRAGLSQAELARRIGIARPSVSIMEAGRAAPAMDTAERWAKACGADLVVVDAEGAALAESLAGLEPVDRELLLKLARNLGRLSRDVRGMLAVLLAQAEEQQRGTG